MSVHRTAVRLLAFGRSASGARRFGTNTKKPTTAPKVEVAAEGSAKASSSGGSQHSNSPPPQGSKSITNLLLAAIVVGLPASGVYQFKNDGAFREFVRDKVPELYATLEDKIPASEGVHVPPLPTAPKVPPPLPEVKPSPAVVEVVNKAADGSVTEPGKKDTVDKKETNAEVKKVEAKQPEQRPEKAAAKPPVLEKPKEAPKPAVVAPVAPATPVSPPQAAAPVPPQPAAVPAPAPVAPVKPAPPTPKVEKKAPATVSLSEPKNPIRNKASEEGVRLQSALQAQQDRDRKEFNKVLLREEENHAKDLKEMEKKYKIDYANKLRAELDRLDGEYRKEVERMRDIIRNTERADAQAAATERLENFRQRFEREREDRVNRIEELSLKVMALDQVMVGDVEYQKVSHKVSSLSAAVFNLTNVLDKNASFKGELEALKRASAGDPVVASASAVIPDHVAENGIATRSEMYDRFKVVRKMASRAALVPEDSGLWGHALATVVSWGMIQEKGLVEGDSVDAKLSRAEWYLSKGNLDSAVSEVETLSGLPRDIAQDWLATARDRLVAEQALDVVKAHVTTLAASLT